MKFKFNVTLHLDEPITRPNFSSAFLSSSSFSSFISSTLFSSISTFCSCYKICDSHYQSKVFILRFFSFFSVLWGIPSSAQDLFLVQCSGFTPGEGHMRCQESNSVWHHSSQLTYSLYYHSYSFSTFCF